MRSAILRLRSVGGRVASRRQRDGSKKGSIPTARSTPSKSSSTRKRRCAGRRSEVQILPPLLREGGGDGAFSRREPL